MKFVGLLFCMTVFVAHSSAAPLCTPSPGMWCEQSLGDAGSLPYTAQPTKGVGNLNAIIGSIANGVTGADFYSVLIPDTKLFSASFLADLNGSPAESNAAIFLFDSQGNAVEGANEATLLGGFIGAPGIYYVGIAPNNNAPLYEAAGSLKPIFGIFTDGQSAKPLPGAGPVVQFTNTGCGDGCLGAYQITFSGTQFSNAPEPGSFALLGVALSASSLLYRFRSLRLS